MTVPQTVSRSFMAAVDGLPTLEWNVELTATCPKCGSVAHVHARDGGTAVICLQCKWSVDRPADALTTVADVLRQVPS
jgi:transcription elongation factor Elf1